MVLQCRGLAWSGTTSTSKQYVEFAVYKSVDRFVTCDRSPRTEREGAGDICGDISKKRKDGRRDRARSDWSSSTVHETSTGWGAEVMKRVGLSRPEQDNDGSARRRCPESDTATAVAGFFESSDSSS